MILENAKFTKTKNKIMNEQASCEAYKTIELIEIQHKLRKYANKIRNVSYTRTKGDGTSHDNLANKQVE